MVDSEPFAMETGSRTLGKPETSPRRRGRYRPLRHLTLSDRVMMRVMLIVPLVTVFAFVWMPAVASIGFSFTDAQGARDITWIGSRNYDTLFNEDYQFWPAIMNNAIWLIVFIVIATPLGILFAVVIDREIQGTRFYQSVFFLPVMLSLALIGIIWQLMYSPDNGLINNIIGKTGHGNQIDWLGDPSINLWAVLIEATWRQSGYVMVLYLAGLKAFDPSLREAASIDGAGEWHTFWKIVLPVLRPVNTIIIVVTVIESLRAFDLVYVTNGGTNGLELLSAMITQQIRGAANRIGYGSSIGVVLLLISLVPIVYLLIKRFKEDQTQ